MVRDKVIMSAIRQAYRNCIPASAYPVVILFLELPFEEVDVNAHPAKTEVRFRNQSEVHRLVFNTVVQALIRSASIPAFSHRPANETNWESAPVPVVSTLPQTSDAYGGNAFDFTSPAASSDPFQRALNYPFREVSTDLHEKSMEHFSLRLSPDMLLGSTIESRSAFQTGGVRILGQMQDSYIIACDSRGLLIIDQHVAHERILYEKLAAAMQSSTVETQGLLVPISLELPPHQMALLERMMPELNRNGFQVEHFGGNTVLIRSVPAIAGDSDHQKLLSEILEGLEKEERTLDVERIRDRIAVSTACRAAIKVNMPLTIEKMQWLLDQLALTRIPTNCPHGRPVILRFSMYEIERNFGRV
jgi:DNA mismatch repair protein MutL